MPSRNRSSRTCTCVRFLRIACAGACAAVHLGLARTSRPWIADVRPLVVAELARPSLVLADLTSHGHSGPSEVAAGTAHLPSQADHTHQDDLGNAASRVAFGMESMVVGVEEGM